MPGYWLVHTAQDRGTLAPFCILSYRSRGLQALLSWLREPLLCQTPPQASMLNSVQDLLQCHKAPAAMARPAVLPAPMWASFRSHVES